MSQFQQLLQAFIASDKTSLLINGKIGLEKEGLRVASDGKIAQTPHPAPFGAALTNPEITTDYAEALLELITPPCASATEALDYLEDLHRFVHLNLSDELLWNNSMPCIVESEEQIAIARYGHSHAGMMKHIYRRGLGYRYGRTMQVIAGIHVNHSFSPQFWQTLQTVEADPQSLPTFIAERSFGMLRNLQRIGWIIPYLFGSSPAISKSFLGGAKTTLEAFDQLTYYGTFAASLRMGDIGYQNNQGNEIGVKACYDNLEEYVDTLTYATETSYPGYRKIGVKVDGEYRQLNDSILQIENEYYSTVRPKQLAKRNEKPLHALMRRGLAYIELRSLDINPFAPAGVTLQQLNFIEMLFIYTLLAESPAISPWERVEIDRNEMEAAHHGRRHNLQLRRDGETVIARQWCHEVVEQLQQIATALDNHLGGHAYAEALEMPRQVIHDPGNSLAERIIREMRCNSEGFFEFAERTSLSAKRQLLSTPLSSERNAAFLATARHSITQQAALEAGDSGSFDDYLDNYLHQTIGNTPSEYQLG
ncbi:MAG: glutamate--cysteine ligase [Gammaproteobacteria bacterium]|nr:glutamate--cysteine ligase [Gammaproteobacteria bacterium]